MYGTPIPYPIPKYMLWFLGKLLNSNHIKHNLMNFFHWISIAVQGCFAEITLSLPARLRVNKNKRGYSRQFPEDQSRLKKGLRASESALFSPLHASKTSKTRGKSVEGRCESAKAFVGKWKIECVNYDSETVTSSITDHWYLRVRDFSFPWIPLA